MTAKLNPNALEYHPIPPGIAPYPLASLPFIISPLPHAARPHPLPSPSLPPPLLPHQILAYLPSASHNTQQLYLTYYFTPGNQVSTNPPTTAAASGRGSSSTQRGRWSGRGRERGEARESCRVRSSKLQQYSKRGMEKKHVIVPLKRDEEQTTVMIKNIPYDCPREELMGMLDDFCSLENRKAGNEGTSTREADKQSITYAYDFLYLPIDFRTKKSRGFAFVNFTNSRAVWKFFDSFHQKNWDYVERLKWHKKIEIVSAKIQGKEALVNHFSQSTFECETDEFLPLCFSPARDGSGQPIELTVVGIRRPIARGKSRYAYNHEA